MKRFWDILDRPRWRDGGTVRYRTDRLALVLRLADVVLFPVCVLGIFYVWHWTLFAAVLLVGVAAQIAANARLGIVVRRLEATTGAGEVAEGASRGVAARFEAAWVLAVLRLVSSASGAVGSKQPDSMTAPMLPPAAERAVLSADTAHVPTVSADGLPD